MAPEVFRRSTLLDPGQAFTCSWPTKGISSSWVQAGVPAVVYDNSADRLPNGVGAPNADRAQIGSTLRWVRPFDTNNVNVEISVLNRHSYAPTSFARLRVIVCAMSSLHSYMAAEFYAAADETGNHINQLLFAKGVEATEVEYTDTPVDHMLVDNEQITVAYDQESDTLSVHSGDQPVAEWAATGRPHGPGFRYLALSWVTSPATDGLQVTSWKALGHA